MTTTRRHHTGARLHRTLSFRLVVSFIALMAIVVSVVGLITVTMLQRYLVQNLDDDLRSSGHLLAKQSVDSLVQSPAVTVPNANQSTSDINLSDYFIYIKVTRLTGPLSRELRTQTVTKVNTNVVTSHGTPADPQDLLGTVGTNPTTVSGTATESWRAIVIPVVDQDSGDSLGSVLVARPLGPIFTTVTQVTRLVILVSLAVITFGAIAVAMLVRGSLKPLRNIENATHKIAAGDLSRRVPRGQDGTEVAMLADSINAMLAQIEQAFAVRIHSEQKMRQFVSDASHELRTPLATVRGYAELYRLGGVPDSEMKPTMNRIESEAKRMTRLVEDLLQLARLDEGRPLDLKAINLTAICRDAVADYHARNLSRSAELIGLDGGAPEQLTIVADRDKVTQVVSNLLSNVLTHTPEGTACEVAIGQRVPDETIVEIRDHGPGVKPEDAAHLFERFYRTDSSRTRASGGSGLGMAIVAAVMASHGGTARVSQTPGGGLTVTLTFPTNGPRPLNPIQHPEDQTAMNHQASPGVQTPGPASLQ